MNLIHTAFFQSRFRFLFSLQNGQLGDEHCGEDEGAAEELPAGGHLAQQQDAAQDGEHRLQAHEQGRHRGGGVLLSHHLQGVGHTAGEDAGVQNGGQSALDGAPGGVLEEEHDDAREDASGQQLDKRQLDGVGAGHEVIHAQDVEAEAEGTEDGQRVPTGQHQRAVDAQEVEPDRGHHHAAPNLRRHLLMEEQAEHGH